MKKQDSELVPPTSRVGTTRRRVFITAVLTTWLVAVATVFAATILGLRFNVSPSVPLGFYRLLRDAPVRGDYVIACPSQSDVFRLARERGYLWGGTCPGDFLPIIKVLAAAQGDDVRIDAGGVRINGVLWPSSAPRSVDRAGAPLPQLTGYHGVLGRNQVLLMSENNLLGFDARYFGLLSSSAISAAAIPVLTW